MKFHLESYIIYPALCALPPVLVWAWHSSLLPGWDCGWQWMGAVARAGPGSGCSKAELWRLQQRHDSTVAALGQGAGCRALAARSRVTPPPPSPTSCYLDLAGLIAGLAGGWAGCRADCGDGSGHGDGAHTALQTHRHYGHSTDNTARWLVCAGGGPVCCSSSSP